MNVIVITAYSLRKPSMDYGVPDVRQIANETKDVESPLEQIGSNNSLSKKTGTWRVLL